MQLSERQGTLRVKRYVTNRKTFSRFLRRASFRTSVDLWSQLQWTNCAGSLLFSKQIVNETITYGFWKWKKSHRAFKGTVTRIEKALINNRLHVLKVSGKFRLLAIYNFLWFNCEMRYFLKKYPIFKSFYCLFCL